MTVPEFEDISLKIGITFICLYMLFIVYDLAKQSKAGKFGTFILFIGLGLGIFGFAAKGLIEYFMTGKTG